MNKISIQILIVLSAVVITACGPKVVEESGSAVTSDNSSGIFTRPTTGTVEASPSNVGTSGISDGVHSVVVQEVLPTAKYVYLKVTENGEEFWIATNKQEIQKGATYFYRGGLLKTNFESKEYNRVFDRIYLVSKLVPEQHGGGSPLPSGASPANTNSWSGSSTSAPAPDPSAIKIAELVQNPTKYEGKTIRLQGKCVKINPNIMNRNWVHLQDGSRDDFDLVITTTQNVQLGTDIVIEAIVSLNKDFGAGYAYELILENGSLIN